MFATGEWVARAHFPAGGFRYPDGRDRLDSYISRR